MDILIILHFNLQGGQGRSGENGQDGKPGIAVSAHFLFYTQVEVIYSRNS